MADSEFRFVVVFIQCTFSVRMLAPLAGTGKEIFSDTCEPFHSVVWELLQVLNFQLCSENLPSYLLSKL